VCVEGKKDLQWVHSAWEPECDQRKRQKQCSIAHRILPLPACSNGILERWVSNTVLTIDCSRTKTTDTILGGSLSFYYPC
jgi:hypothetical protein